jgi:tRNA threonylcarbamoyladenosine biosynthesis protein TsaB
VSTVVGWDTATADVTVALVRDGEPVVERLVEAEPGGRPRHARALLAEVESAVGEVGGWASIEMLAVGLGPGSFTGLRIGLATGRALAQALAKPIVGVGTLAAIGRGIREGSPGRHGLAVLDARRGQAFAAMCDPQGEQVWPPLVADPDELAERVGSLPEGPLAAGSGALRFRRQLEAAGADVPPGSDPAHRVSGRHVCLLAETGTPSAPEAMRPIYLRPPDAELWLERDAR